MDRHYIESVTATTHQEKGIITLESNPSRELYYQLHTAKGTSVTNIFELIVLALLIVSVMFQL